MESSVTPDRDRRAMPRRSGVEEHEVVSARIRPGHSARLINVSATGALLDTPFRLLPGATIEIRVATRHEPHIVVRGEVVRCALVRLEPTIYEGAVRFDRPVALLGARGYSLHDPAPLDSADAREDATRGLL